MRFVALALLTACWTSSSPEPKPAQQPKELVQPVAIEKQEVAGDPGGEEGGVEGGVVGGDPCGGTVGGVVGRPPALTGGGMPPQNVAPTLLEGNRIAGDKNIVPDDADKVQIQQSGKDKIIGSWKLCVTDGGVVSQIVNLKSTGFPNYDRKVEREMRAWRYRPYLVNNQPAPVCTAVTFIYAQSARTSLPPPPP